jgi:hypothetical protein
VSKEGGQGGRRPEELSKETNVKTTHRVAAALAVPALALVALTPPATASGGDDNRVERNGSCSAGTVWKIKAKSDDGGIEVEAEIDSNKVGQTWTWTFKHNGSVFSAGQSTTTARSGSFEVERKPADFAGTDYFVFRAVYPSSGEVCRATVSW